MELAKKKLVWTAKSGHMGLLKTKQLQLLKMGSLVSVG